MNISCKFDSQVPVVPFAYRTHAHGLGVVISGYVQHEGEWKMIGKGNPQWPQMFYPVKEQLVVKPGDKVAAQCVYNSTGRDWPTTIG